jgi:nucleoside-diphosphate-sugar epimerase
MVYGPLRHSIKDIKELNQSNSVIYNNFINSSKDAPLPPNGMHVYTDVRVRNTPPSPFPGTHHSNLHPKDLAHAHILAATVPSASNSRFIICAGQISAQEIADMLRKHIPELAEKTPIGKPGTSSLPENAYTCSSELAERVLGLRFRGKEETFVELARQLVGIEGER